MYITFDEFVEVVSRLIQASKMGNIDEREFLIQLQRALELLSEDE